MLSLIIFLKWHISVFFPPTPHLCASDYNLKKQVVLFIAAFSFPQTTSYFLSSLTYK